jgi:hypothetical protein
MTGDGYDDPNAEGRVLTAEYDGFYYVTVYTPNAKDDLSRIPLRMDHWDPAFLEYVKGLETGIFGGTPRPVDLVVDDVLPDLHVRVIDAETGQLLRQTWNRSSMLPLPPSRTLSFGGDGDNLHSLVPLGTSALTCGWRPAAIAGCCRGTTPP